MDRMFLLISQPSVHPEIMIQSQILLLTFNHNIRDAQQNEITMYFSHDKTSWINIREYKIQQCEDIFHIWLIR